MTKKYWAVYDDDAGTLELAPGKYSNEEQALDATFTPRGLKLGDMNVRAQALSSRKALAMDTYTTLKQEHTDARKREAYKVTMAHRDVESEIMQKMQVTVETYNQALKEFAAKVQSDGPAEAIRWRGDNIMEHEFNAAMAETVIALVNRTHGDNDPRRQHTRDSDPAKGRWNPVKALRLVHAQVQRDLLENRFASTASGLFSASTGAARQQAASRWLGNGHLAWLRSAAEERNERRVEMGLAPIDYEAPWQPGTDSHGNTVAKEGADICSCGCKYWENDRCVDCGALVTDGSDAVGV